MRRWQVGPTEETDGRPPHRLRRTPTHRPTRSGKGATTRISHRRTKYRRHCRRGSRNVLEDHAAQETVKSALDGKTRACSSLSSVFLAVPKAWPRRRVTRNRQARWSRRARAQGTPVRRPRWPDGSAPMCRVVRWGYAGPWIATKVGDSDGNELEYLQSADHPPPADDRKSHLRLLSAGRRHGDNQPNP